MSTGRVESPSAALERVILSFFSPPGSCRVQIESHSPGDALQGRFSRVKLEARQSTVKGMPIQSATIELHEMALDYAELRRSQKIRVYSAASIKYRVELSQTGLNWLISGKKKLGNARPPRLELGVDQVVLDGHLSMGLFNSGFRLKGRLEPHREHELHFVPDSVSVGWLTLPGFVMDAAAERLNPVLTLEKFLELKRCNLKIREVIVTPGLLTVEG